MNRARRALAPLGYRPLLVLLGAGLALRLLVLAVYDHAIFNHYGGDSRRYLRLPEHGGLFDDAYTPAGYPAFLKAVREVSSALPFTIGVQHLIGLATAVVLVAAGRLGKKTGAGFYEY